VAVPVNAIFPVMSEPVLFVGVTVTSKVVFVEGSAPSWVFVIESEYSSLSKLLTATSSGSKLL